MNGKKGTSSEIYLLWHKEMVCKRGKRIALAMGKDGWMDGWMDETVFSCLKRTFDGEYVYSEGRLKNIIREIILKASLYNKMISI